MPEHSVIESILHMGVLGLVATAIPIVSALWLLIIRIIGIFSVTRIDTVREVALLFIGPIIIFLYSAASLSDRLKVYFHGTGFDTTSLKVGLAGFSYIYWVAFLSFLLAFAAACLPRKR